MEVFVSHTPLYKSKRWKEQKNAIKAISAAYNNFPFLRLSKLIEEKELIRLGTLLDDLEIFKRIKELDAEIPEPIRVDKETARGNTNGGAVQLESLGEVEVVTLRNLSHPLSLLDEGLAFISSLRSHNASQKSGGWRRILQASSTSILKSSSAPIFPTAAPDSGVASNYNLLEVD